MVGKFLRSIVLWWRSVLKEEHEPAVAQRVLITLSDDQMVIGVISKQKSYGLQIDKAAISSEGKFVHLPAPGVVVLPSRRILMIQHLPEEASLDVVPES